MTVVVVGTALALLIGSQLTPKYTATAAVVIDSTDAQLLDVIDQGRGASENSMVATEIELITSRSLIGRVMADLKLFDDPEFRPPVSEGDGQVTINLPEPLASVAGLLPESWLRAVGAAEDGLTPAEAADQANVAEATVERFMTRLEVAQAGGANVIEIGVTSRDPEKAARIANGIAEAYVNAQVERKRRAAGSAASWLADRLTELQHDVEAAEKEAAEFRASNGLFNSGAGDGGTLNDQKILDLNRQLVALRAEQAGARGQAQPGARLRPGGLGRGAELAPDRDAARRGGDAPAAGGRTGPDLWPPPSDDDQSARRDRRGPGQDPHRGRARRAQPRR